MRTRLLRSTLCLALLFTFAGCSRNAAPTPASTERAATAPVPEGACGLPDGRVCPAGALCADEQGCNYCSCTDGHLICTGMGCEAQRVKTACQGPADCGGRQCLFDQGCGEAAQGWCLQALCGAHSGPEQEWCGCDGVTFQASCPERPYAHLGACR